MRMPRLPGTKTTRNVLGLSIESNRVAAAVLHRKNGQGDVTATCELPMTPEQLLADPEQAGRELGACLQQAGIRAKRCALCLPPAWALTTAVEVPPIPPEDLHSYFDLQAEREFPMPPTELQLAYSQYRLPDGLAMATLAVIPTDRLELVSRLLAAAGCRALSISLGIDVCLRDHDTGGSVNFIANGTHVDVVICAGGGVVDLRSLDGAPVPDDRASALEPGTLQRELRITLGRLPESLRAQIHSGRFLGRIPSARALRSAVETPLRAWGIQHLEGGDTRADTEDVRTGAAAVAATRHLYGRPATFEFVLPRVSRLHALLKRLSTRRNRIVSVAVPSLLALVVLTLVMRSQYEKRLETRWAGMEETVTELEAVQERIRQFRPWFSDSPESLELMHGLTSAFPATGEIWVRRVELEGNRKISCTGLARDHAALMAVLDQLHEQPGIDDVQIQQVRGETPVQFAFTYTWRRDARD